MLLAAEARAAGASSRGERRGGRGGRGGVPAGDATTSIAAIWTQQRLTARGCGGSDGGALFRRQRQASAGDGGRILLARQARRRTRHKANQAWGAMAVEQQQQEGSSLAA